jgi:hypothetical protein
MEPEMREVTKHTWLRDFSRPSETPWLLSWLCDPATIASIAAVIAGLLIEMLGQAFARGVIG